MPPLRFIFAEKVVSRKLGRSLRSKAHDDEDRGGKRIDDSADVLRRTEIPVPFSPAAERVSPVVAWLGSSGKA
jgi:hypothetical protein